MLEDTCSEKELLALNRGYDGKSEGSRHSFNQVCVCVWGGGGSVFSQCGCG